MVEAPLHRCTVAFDGGLDILNSLKSSSKPPICPGGRLFFHDSKSNGQTRTHPGALGATSPNAQSHWSTPSQACRWPQFTRVNPFLAIQPPNVSRFSHSHPTMAGLLDLGLNNSAHASHARSRVAGLERYGMRRGVFGSTFLGSLFFYNPSRPSPSPTLEHGH